MPYNFDDDPSYVNYVLDREDHQTIFHVLIVPSDYVYITEKTKVIDFPDTTKLVSKDSAKEIWEHRVNIGYNRIK